jgi:hypothetical protein
MYSSTGKCTSEIMQAIPNVAIHQKACNFFRKQMQFSAMSFYCTTNVNLHLFDTVPAASTVTGQRTIVEALGITKGVKQQVNAMSVAGLKHGHERLRPYRQNSKE